MIGVSAVRVTNRRAAAMLLAGFAIAASSCQRAGSATAAALLAVDPAMTCASPDTYAGAKSALLSSIEAPADSTPERDKMRTEIMRAVTITFSQPALESFDRDTKKVVCTANDPRETPTISPSNGRTELETDEVTILGLRPDLPL
jgi:hypothetical protein